MDKQVVHAFDETVSHAGSIMVNVHGYNLTGLTAMFFDDSLEKTPFRALVISWGVIQKQEQPSSRLGRVCQVKQPALEQSEPETQPRLSFLVECPDLPPSE